MRRWLFEQGLSLFFLAIFLLSAAGQWILGARAYNAEQAAHGEETLSYWRYLFSSDFGGNLLENWQSEFLQFALFIYVTIWLVQRGSNESKQLTQVGRESDQKQQVKGYAKSNSPLWARVGGLRTRIYENSLLIAFAVIFFGSWLAQAVTGWTDYNDEQEEHGDPTVSLATYLTRPNFWEKTLQNWQSEFLAVGTMAVLAIYLRQRGSPESKPVGAGHEETGSSG